MMDQRARGAAALGAAGSPGALVAGAEVGLVAVVPFLASLMRIASA